MSSPIIQATILTPPGSQTSSPVARTTQEVIDEDGDMIITISQSSFLVSSKAISLASPVFRTKFKKSRQQESASSGRLHKFSLPEEDREAFVIFCNIAHHRIEALPKNVDIAGLYEITLFIQKYRCASAMAERCSGWIQHASKGAPPEDLWDLLLLAYLLDSQKYVSRISRMLVSMREGRFRRWDFAVNNLDFLPASALDLLDEFRETVSSKVEMTLLKPLTKTGTGTCRRLAAFIVAYATSLRNAGILPGTEEFRFKTLSKIYTDAASLLPDTLGEFHPGCDDCSMVKEYVSSEKLLNQLNRCVNEEVGLCLLCLRNNKECRKHAKAVLDER
ncbi:hypothetical protein BJX68DRAFT_266150 [Aspergillus pseudodeflectus]|uniref:BTB domain-containing protein n=1 Tax=Aspergillus pseudodeflectus TaxID=176178 RepID=A0ABR4KG27_9EURO